MKSEPPPLQDLYGELCSYENLEIAYKKARKGKTKKDYVIEFEKDLKENLLQLRFELLFHSYKPKPLQTFILRDPKTRKISKSDFRDRIVHHTLHNIIEPLFEKCFIYDSYANRKGKGVLKTIRRFEQFQRKASNNNSRTCFVLKADIYHYFDSVHHDILLPILSRKIPDERILWLISIILRNHKTKQTGVGMPLGNLTSQFFANVYLNELDQFVKHELKAKYYIRYVDDFVILDSSKKKLKLHKQKIDRFLKEQLALELHPSKSKIIQSKRGISFLGLRIFLHHRLLKQRNLKKFQRKLKHLCSAYACKIIDYDNMYDFLEGWYAYTKQANTYKLRKRLLKPIKEKFRSEYATKEFNRLMKEFKISIS